MLILSSTLNQFIGSLQCLKKRTANVMVMFAPFSEVIVQFSNRFGTAIKQEMEDKTTVALDER